MKLLQIHDLKAGYDKLQILNGINLHVNKGEIVAIIGPNGAGKSTVLKSIFGLTKRNGQILFNSHDIVRRRPEELVSLGLSYVSQGRPIFSTLTVKENIELGRYAQGPSEEQLHIIYKLFPVLKERSSQKAGLLSGGEQQMVAIARALMLQPQLLLLDEPSLGLSPKVKREIFGKIKDINKTGVTILMVEQNARMALEMSDRAYVLESGNNKLEGTGKELLHDTRVQHLYLGGAF